MRKRHGIFFLICSFLSIAYGFAAEPKAAPSTADWRATVRQLAKTHFRNPAWGYSHSERDYALARSLAASDQVALDDDVLFAACYLHDMAAFPPWGGDEPPDHSDVGADAVEKILIGTGFPMNKVEAVRAAIRTHMYYRDPVAPEAVYLHDADALDWLGAIGAARLIALVDPNGGDPDGPKVVKMLEDNLRQVPSRVVSPAGRAMVGPRKSELEGFLKELGNESADFQTYSQAVSAERTPKSWVGAQPGHQFGGKGTFIENGGMNSAADPTGTIDVALAHAGRLMASNPALALEQASEILKAVPNHPVATLLLGVAQRATGDNGAALRTLKALTDAQHRWAMAHYELGRSLGEAQQTDAAIIAFRHAVELKPDMPDPWRALGDMLTIAGDATGADAAYARNIQASTNDPRLREAAAALISGDIPQAETILRAHLLQFPTDVAALRMLSEVAARLQRDGDAETLLERCLELAPSFNAGRYHYAMILHRRNKPAEALQQLDLLLRADPRNPAYLNSQAVVLAKIGDYKEALELYAQVLAKNPTGPKIWMSYGHALSAAGRQKESIAAYRRSIRIAPNLGESYWSLANLKTFRFDDAELAAMRAQLERKDLGEEDRFHFHFALGKALEDSGDYAASFAHYVEGNRLRREGIEYDAAGTDALVQRARDTFTPEFFARRSGFGARSPDPIFVVGLPRAGSTLIEQILASHSQVEGTMELQNIMNMVRELRAEKSEEEEPNYVRVLAQMDAGQCRELGERFIEETRILRKTSRPYFIDKMPNNWLYIGFIHLILPNAKIIDARRHPMACCFSNFKQHFARGQHYTYSLEEIGRYYAKYVELMAHMDRVLPGKIHRVYHERMIEDTEGEVRRMLDFCGLPFEETCLRFYENERAVRTASANQVRRPIFREGLDQWRHFEPWLDPLKAALGPTLDAYPSAPDG